MRPCVGLHDCRKALSEFKEEKSRVNNESKACLSLDCDPQANLSNPIHVTNSIFNVRVNDWTLKNTGGYNPNKNRVQWMTEVIKVSRCTILGTFTIHGVMGILNSGNGTADLGNMVVNFQTRKCGSEWKTKHSAVASVFKTNCKIQGNIVPEAACKPFYVNSHNAKLHVIDLEGNDVFASEDSSLRKIKPCEFKYFGFTADFIIPTNFKKEVRAQILMTFGNSGVGCNGFHGDNIAYKGGCVLYDNVFTIVYERVQGIIELEEYQKDVILRTNLSNTNVVLGGGSYRNFTTEIISDDGIVGSEKILSNATRNTCILPCPIFQTTERIFQNTVTLSNQTDTVFFNLPVSPTVTDRTVRFTFIIPNSTLHHTRSSNVSVVKPVCENTSTPSDKPNYRSIPQNTSQPPVQYTAIDLADDVDGEFTSLWNDNFASTGLILKVPVLDSDVETYTITFTDPEPVRANLALITAAPGTVTSNMMNPYSTSAGSTLSYVLWMLFNLLQHQSLKTKQVDSIQMLLDLDQSNIVSGLEQQIVDSDAMTMETVLSLGLSFVLGGTPINAGLGKTVGSALASLPIIAPGWDVLIDKALINTYRYSGL